MTDKLINDLAGRIFKDLFGEMKNDATRDQFMETITSCISNFAAEHGDMKLSNLEKEGLQQMIKDGFVAAFMESAVLKPLKDTLQPCAVQIVPFPEPTTTYEIQAIPPAPHHPDLYGDVEAFHHQFGLEIDITDGPRDLEPELEIFRQKFMEEELREYLDADAEMDGLREHPLANPEELESALAALRAKKLDALVDLIYVAIGTAYLHGWDFNEAWRRVQAANMAKIRAERQEEGKRDATYDVVKPPGWTAPDHSDLVRFKDPNEDLVLIF